MRKAPARFQLLLTVIAGLAISVATSSAAWAFDPASAAGLWEKVEDGRAVVYVLMIDHNGIFEGVMAKTFPKSAAAAEREVCTKCTDDRRNAPWQGISFVRDMKRDGFKYENGNVLDPRDGKVYSAKMTLSPDGQQLTLRGYIGISLLGKDEIWYRLPDAAMAEIDPAIIARYLPAQATAAIKPTVGRKH